MNWTAIIELLTLKEKLVGHPTLSGLMQLVDAEIAKVKVAVEKEVQKLEGVTPPVTPPPPMAIPSTPPKGGPNG